MESFATRQDISELRADMGRMWADVRDDAKEHAGDDVRRFDGADKKIDAVDGKVDLLTGIVKEWTGALAMSKWCLGIGIPLILGTLLTHLVRHWNG